VHEQIPCNCANCVKLDEPYFYDYELLQGRLKHGKYEVECQKPPYDSVNINRLIAAVIEPEHERRRRDELLDELDSDAQGGVTHNNYHINSEGGAVIVGQADVGGDLVGRDSIEQG